jgi:four helix bundle suffix protein
MSYRELKSYQSATIIYDFTVVFVKRYIDFKSRTCDQMVQAARSGKQNIVEASAERASRKSELKLLGVARASLEELLADYEDFLRQSGLTQRPPDSAETQQIRRLPYRTDWSYRSYQPYLSNPTDAANAMLCLINQCNFLLDRQIKVLEDRFVREGGWTEQIFARRLTARRENQ